MTTWESIDNVDMENVTFTSDVAYERVTSDEHFEEERNWWYLKQNTSWLVQEIPNISFLDIWDTMLEWKKTLYGKNNWNIVVWTQWKSIEAIPQDSFNLRMWWDQSVSQLNSVVQFDTWDATDDSTTMEFDSANYRIMILRDWYYRISYWRTVDLGSATELLVAIVKNTEDIIWEEFKWISWTRLSWWRTISKFLEAGKYIIMRVEANSSNIKINEKYTYLELQYIWQSI